MQRTEDRRTRDDKISKIVSSAIICFVICDHLCEPSEARKKWNL
jgi:hypothetical protein